MAILYTICVLAQQQQQHQEIERHSFQAIIQQIEAQSQLEARQLNNFKFKVK